MPISISAAQNKAIQSGILDKETQGGVAFGTVTNVLEQYAVLFEENLRIVSNEVNNVASGKLLDSFEFQVTNDGNTLLLYLADYFDYTNVGVKGVRSSRNAPSSPYQYKNYGMSQEGRRSIRSYIESGKAKITTVQRQGLRATNREKKQLSLIDLKTQTLIYMIKRYGIKATRYLDKTIAMTFKDLGEKLGEAVASDISYTVNTLNKK
jgi:hypothetical protein